MKKMTKIAALALCGCILSGCADNPFVQTKPDFSAGYTMTADINCGKLEAVAEVSYIDENEWEFTFSEPKALAGMTLKFGEKGLKGELGALDFNVDDNQSYSLLPEIIAKAVDSLAEIPAEKRTVSDGVITLETQFREKPVTVTADVSGKLISLKCPYYSLAVNFSNRKKIPPKPAAESSSEEATVTITPVE